MGLARTRRLWIVLMVLVFYSNITVYLETLWFPPAKSLYWMLFFGLGLLILVLLSQSIPGGWLASPLFYWVTLYLVIAVLWFMASDEQAVVAQSLHDRILTVLFLTMLLFQFSEARNVHILVRRTLLFVVLATVVFNLLQWFGILPLIPATSALYIPGRASGLYLNANESAAALILGVLFTIHIVPSRYRLAYLILTFLGILVTFSRAGLFGFFLVISLLIYQKVLPLNRAFVIAGLMAALFALLPWMKNLVLTETGSNLNVLQRIDWLSQPGDLSDASAQARLMVARQAWDMFTKHPWLGNGIGSTENWSWDISTHNIYLFFMADYGIIGALILPLLLVAIAWGARGEAKQIALPFVVFVSFWGFFSHHFFSEYYFLIAIALMAIMSQQVGANHDPIQT